jgi:hypothetical protein
MGTRPDPSGCTEAPDQAVHRFEGNDVPPRHPVPNRVHHQYKGARQPPKRDAFKGENPGSLRGVQVNRAVAKPELQEDEESAGFDSEDAPRNGSGDVTGEHGRDHPCSVRRPPVSIP